MYISWTHSRIVDMEEDDKQKNYSWISMTVSYNFFVAIVINFIVYFFSHPYTFSIVPFAWFIGRATTTFFLVVRGTDKELDRTMKITFGRWRRESANKSFVRYIGYFFVFCLNVNNEDGGLINFWWRSMPRGLTVYVEVYELFVFEANVVTLYYNAFV